MLKRPLGVTAILVMGLSVPTLAQDEGEYEVGIAYPVISSTYDVHPQIQNLPSEPHARLVPIHKLALEERDEGFQPRDRKVEKYSGFEGIDQTPWSPPDPTLAVGVDHVVETVNMSIAFYLKDGTLQFSQRLDNSGNPGFFEDVGAGDFTFDPKCYYDHHSDRFVVVALEVYSNTAYITIGVSDDGDPNGTWYKYRTDAKTQVGGNSYWVDYPGLGGDEDAIYVTGNLFGFSSGFAGAKYRIFDKTPMLSGQPVVFFDLRSGSSASVQVAYRTDSGIAYFTSVEDSNEIKVQTVVNPLTSPSLRTVDVNVPSFSSPPSAPTTGGSISTLDGRIMNAYMDGTRLVTTHCIGASGRAQSRWYEFDLNNWPSSGTVSLTQSGNVDFGSGIHNFFPAVAINANGDIGMMLGRSASNEPPSVWYTRQLFGGPSGTMEPPIEMKAGESGASGRWGDYFDAAVDAADDVTFWGVGEYANSGGWSTWIGPFDFDGGEPEPCPGDCIDPFPFGTGTAGTGGLVPTIASNGCPTTGNSNFAIEGADFLSGASGLLFIGLDPNSVDGGGWTLYVDPILSIPVNYAGGASSFVLEIPNNPFIDGLKFYAQYIANDPGAPFGVSASPGLESTICHD